MVDTEKVEVETDKLVLKAGKVEIITSVGSSGEVGFRETHVLIDGKPAQGVVSISFNTDVSGCPTLVFETIAGMFP